MTEKTTASAEKTTTQQQAEAWHHAAVQWHAAADAIAHAWAAECTAIMTGCPGTPEE